MDKFMISEDEMHELLSEITEMYGHDLDTHLLLHRVENKLLELTDEFNRRRCRGRGLQLEDVLVLRSLLCEMDLYTKYLLALEMWQQPA